MRKIVQFMHVSFRWIRGWTNGEMDWIKVNEELFDFASDRTHQSDCALYGRNTWPMMDGYWPTAANQPNPSKHDLGAQRMVHEGRQVYLVTDHAVDTGKRRFMRVIGSNLAGEIHGLKNKP